MQSIIQMQDTACRVVNRGMGIIFGGRGSSAIFSLVSAPLRGVGSYDSVRVGQ